jgi:hypothetical protein
MKSRGQQFQKWVYLPPVIDLLAKLHPKQNAMINDAGT